jgi:hypothetical protein
VGAVEAGLAAHLHLHGHHQVVAVDARRHHPATRRIYQLHFSREISTDTDNLTYTHN